MNGWLALALTMVGCIVFAYATIWVLDKIVGEGVACERCGTIRVQRKSGKRVYIYPRNYVRSYGQDIRIAECRALGHTWDDGRRAPRASWRRSRFF